MTTTLSDERADALAFSPPPEGGLRPVFEGDDGSQAVMLVRSALAVFTASLLPYLAGGLLAREGLQVDEVGIRYPGDELDDDEEPFEGVKLVSPMGEVLVGLSAFEHLMSRYLTVFVQWLDQADDPATQLPRFELVRRAARELGER